MAFFLYSLSHSLVICFTSYESIKLGPIRSLCIVRSIISDVSRRWLLRNTKSGAYAD